MEPLIFNSEFIPEVQIAVILDDHPQYGELKPLFDEYGYGFMVPGKNLIIIDGEQFIDNFGTDVLKFIEAHEIAHLLLGHNGPRSEKDEIEADLGAYILLKKNEMSTERLEDEFDSRHGVPFSEDLLDMVKDRL